jgi:thiol-disulfide isomerase/thioredoxin
VSSAGADDARPIEIGGAFVDFGLLQLDLETGKLGRIVWLSDFVGNGARTTPKRLLLLSFFATWCAPCFSELALLNGWQQAYGERGLQVVGVNFRLPEEDADTSARQTRELLNGQKIAFPLLFDRHTQRNQLVYLGARATLPSSLLIGADGRVLFRTQGTRANEMEALEQQLRSALGVEADAAIPAAASSLGAP